MNPWTDFLLHPQIIPTILIPMTAISVVLSSIAVFIAGLFGIKLKADGPKKLLEVLLKPRVLISAFLLNLAMWGGYKGYIWIKNASSLDQIVQWRQSRIEKTSQRTYSEVLSSTEQRVAHSSEKNSATPVLQPVWTKHLPSGAFSEPTLSGESLFVGADDGYVYEIDRTHGETLRQFYVGKPVSPKVLIFQNHLYAGEGVHDTHHARVSKFNLQNGKYVGSFRTTGHIEGQMTIDEQPQKQTLLIVSGGTGGVYAIDPVTLKQIWNSNMGHSESGASIDGDFVYYGTGREKDVVDQNRSWAVAVERSNGHLVWKRELPASSWMPPLVHESKACFVFGEVYFKSEIGGIACFDKNTGENPRVFYHSAPVVSDPMVLNHDYIFTDLNGTTCRIQSESMTKIWCSTEKNNSYFLAGVRYDSASDLLVKSTRKADVVLLDPLSGAEKFRWVPGKKTRVGAFASVALSPDGWFFIDSGGDLVRLTNSPASASK